MLHYLVIFPTVLIVNLYRVCSTPDYLFIMLVVRINDYILYNFFCCAMVQEGIKTFNLTSTLKVNDYFHPLRQKYNHSIRGKSIERLSTNIIQ